MRTLLFILLPIFSFSQTTIFCSQCGDVINTLPHKHKIVTDLKTQSVDILPSYIDWNTFVSKTDTIQVAMLVSNKNSDAVTPRGHDYNPVFVIYGYQINTFKPDFYITYDSTGRRIKEYPYEIRLVNLFYEPLDKYIIWSVYLLYDKD